MFIGWKILGVWLVLLLSSPLHAEHGGGDSGGGAAEAAAGAAAGTAAGSADEAGGDAGGDAEPTPDEVADENVNESKEERESAEKEADSVDQLDKESADKITDEGEKRIDALKEKMDDAPTKEIAKKYRDEIALEEKFLADILVKGAVGDNPGPPPEAVPYNPPTLAAEETSAPLDQQTVMQNIVSEGFTPAASVVAAIPSQPPASAPMAGTTNGATAVGDGSTSFTSSPNNPTTSFTDPGNNFSVTNSGVNTGNNLVANNPAPLPIQRSSSAPTNSTNPFSNGVFSDGNQVFNQGNTRAPNSNSAATASSRPTAPTPAVAAAAPSTFQAAPAAAPQVNPGVAPPTVAPAMAAASAAPPTTTVAAAAAPIALPTSTNNGKAFSQTAATNTMTTVNSQPGPLASDSSIAPSTSEGSTFAQATPNNSPTATVPTRQLASSGDSELTLTSIRSSSSELFNSTTTPMESAVTSSITPAITPYEPTGPAPNLVALAEPEDGVSRGMVEAERGAPINPFKEPHDEDTSSTVAVSSEAETSAPNLESVDLKSILAIVRGEKSEGTSEPENRRSPNPSSYPSVTKPERTAQTTDTEPLELALAEETGLPPQVTRASRLPKPLLELKPKEKSSGSFIDQIADDVARGEKIERMRSLGLGPQANL